MWFGGVYSSGPDWLFVHRSIGIGYSEFHILIHIPLGNNVHCLHFNILNYSGGNGPWSNEEDPRNWPITLGISLIPPWTHGPRRCTAEIHFPALHAQSLYRKPHTETERVLCMGQDSVWSGRRLGWHFVAWRKIRTGKTATEMYFLRDQS